MLRWLRRRCNVHIAIAVTYGVDFLVTWNFRYIDNAADVEKRIRGHPRARQDASGYSPLGNGHLCAPNELLEFDHADDRD